MIYPIKPSIGLGNIVQYELSLLFITDT